MNLKNDIKEVKLCMGIVINLAFLIRSINVLTDTIGEFPIVLFKGTCAEVLLLILFSLMLSASSSLFFSWGLDDLTALIKIKNEVKKK